MPLRVRRARTSPVEYLMLPILRDQGSGHILSVSSMAGVVGEPALSLYNASKWALEGMMEALALEVEDFRVRVTLIEPGLYATDFSTQSILRFATPNAAYDGVRQTLRVAYGPEDIGDAHATSDALFAVVDSPEPPLRLILGRTALRHTRTRYADRLATWEAWAPVSEGAHGSPIDATQEDAPAKLLGIWEIQRHNLSADKPTKSSGPALKTRIEIRQRLWRMCRVCSSTK